MIKSFYIAFENSEEWEHSEDWGVFCSRYRFPDATIKENKVNVAGSNGIIDLSSELTGDVAFNNVKGEIGFIILRDSDFDYLAFKNKYHGKRVKIMPDNDTEHYRIGRLSIKEDNNQDVLKKVAMVLDADPFRYSTTEKFEVVQISTQRADFRVTASEETPYTTQGNSVAFGNIKKTDYREIKRDGITYRVAEVSYRTTISFDVEPQTDYALGFDVLIKHKSDRSLATSGLFHRVINEMPKIEITCGENVVSEVFSKLVFSENSTFSVAQKFNSGNEQTVSISFSSDLASSKKLSSMGIPSISAQDDEIVFSNLSLVGGKKISLYNNGRKQIVPEIVATEDCYMIINGNGAYLNAGETVKNFDFVLDGTENTVIVSGENGGEVTIRYREAYL